ncbi:hypothetical protein [[Eubacterium] cellulosolvens]
MSRPSLMPPRERLLVAVREVYGRNVLAPQFTNPILKKKALAEDGHRWS